MSRSRVQFGWHSLPYFSGHTNRHASNNVHNWRKSDLHRFLDDRRCSCRVLCNSLTRANICCRMMYHWQCTLDPDRMDSLQNRHNVLRGHCMFYTLQTMGIQCPGKDLDLWAKQAFRNLITEYIFQIDQYSGKIARLSLIGEAFLPLLPIRLVFFGGTSIIKLYNTESWWARAAKKERSRLLATLMTT